MAKWFDRLKGSFHLIADDSGRAPNAPARPLLSRSTWWLMTILLLWLPISPFLVTVTGWRGVSLVRDIITVVLVVIGIISRRRNQQPAVIGDVERLGFWL